MGTCTSRDKHASSEQAPQSVPAVPLEELTERIRKLEEENRELKQQVAVLNSRPVHEPVSPERRLLGIDKTHAFAQSFSIASALRSPHPPSPPASRIPPDPDEFYENYVIPSPSHYFRSLMERENEPDLSLDASLDKHTLPSPAPMFALHAACSPTPLPSAMITTATTTLTTIISVSSTTTEQVASSPTSAARLSQSTSAVTITTNFDNSLSPLPRSRSLTSPAVKASSTPYPNTPPLGATRLMSSLHTRRKSSASLSAGTAAAAAALASPGLLSPVSRSSPSPSLRSLPHTSPRSLPHTSPSRPLPLAVDADKEEEVYDESSPSRSRLERTVEEELDTHDELYDCSEEDEESESGMEELPAVTEPLGRTLAAARESRAKLLRKSNALEGLTRIKDTQFLTSKSKLVPSANFTGKVLGLFLVGSNSLSRCAEVLPDVIRWEQSKVRPDFEVLLVWISASKLDPTSTGSATAASEYEQIRKLAPFPAAVFNSALGVVLYEMFCHKGTPSLVILDMDGTIVNTNGLKCEGRRFRISEELEHFPFRPNFDKQALDLFNFIDTDKAGVLTQAKILARSDNQESGEYVYEKLLLEAEGGPITPKVWSALLLAQLKASAGHQSDMEEILDSFQDIFCYRPESAN